MPVKRLDKFETNSLRCQGAATEDDLNDFLK